jgi:hypothetical protein
MSFVASFAALLAFIRPSQAQAPAVLDHSRTVPQGDGRAGAIVPRSPREFT